MSDAGSNPDLKEHEGEETHHETQQLDFLRLVPERKFVYRLLTENASFLGTCAPSETL